MKPDAVKCILASYIREKQYSSQYDECDGLPTDGHYSDPFRAQMSSCESSEPFPAGNGGTLGGDFLHFIQEAHLPSIEPQFGGLNYEQEQIARRIGRRLSNMSDEFEPDSVQENGNQASAIGSKVLQFQQRCVFVSSGSESISLPVTRVGTTGAATVAWRTLDRSARAGLHYVSCRGDVSFADGEGDKSIEVDILPHHREEDVCFQVELLNPDGVTIGSVNPLTVYIVDHTKYNDNERQIIRSITNCGPRISLSHLACCLSDRLSERTFKAALQFACSSATSATAELGLACELYRLAARPHLARTLADVVVGFFRAMPDLEDLVDLL